MNAEPEGLSIIVFAYNEVENVSVILAELIEWLRSHEPKSQIVFVDDGSTDGTYDLAEQSLTNFPSKLVRHSHNRGIGAALKSGVLATHHPWVTFMPADGQIPPSAIGTLRAAATSGHTELVLSVYSNRNDGWHRTVLSKSLRALIFGVHQVILRSEGPYLFRRSLFIGDELKSDSFFLNFEFPIRILRSGFDVKTVTIPCHPRRAGQAKSAALKHIRAVTYDLVSLRIRLLRESFK